MELQINDFITSIKKDGVDAGKREAELIISEAKSEAEKILLDAKKNADLLLDSSKKEIELQKNAAYLTIQQAKRDAVLSFKQEIELLYKKVLKNHVDSILNDKTELTKIIKAVLTNEDVNKYRLEISHVSDLIKQDLQDEINNGLEIKISDSLNYGFKLSLKDNSGFFDCSDDEISKMIFSFIFNNAFWGDNL